MNIFGLDLEQVDELLARVVTTSTGAADAPPCADPAERTDRFARAAWTTIAEPGDGTAGALIAGVGAGQALTAVIEQWQPARILRAAREAAASGAAVSGAAVSSHAASPPELAESEITAALQRWQPRVTSEAVLRALRQAARIGARLMTPSDAAWPTALDDLASHAPLALWWRGRREAFVTFDTSIALVGARAATGYGEHVAMEASAGLVDRGFAIVSGAAYGIDGMVHRSALASKGTTMAFLAGGVDRLYPSGHEALLGRIVETGAVISELACGASPTRWRFLQRNRLIAASTRGTIVLEAGWRSGSLNTAGHAAALGRPLGAVPGPVTSPTAAGCHRLIRDYDAICVTDAAQMAELVGDLAPSREPDDSGHGGPSGTDGSGGQQRTANETRVLDAMSTRSPRSLIEMARRTGLAVTTVQSVVGLLDLEGSVREREAGWVLVAKR